MDTSETEKTRLYLQSIVDTVREPLLILDAGLRVVSASRSFYRTFAVSAPETEGLLIYELNDNQWGIPALRHLLEEIIPQDSSFDDFEVELNLPTVGQRLLLLNARKLYRPGNHSQMLLLAFEDVTDRRVAEARFRDAQERFRLLVEGARDHAIIMLDTRGEVVEWNIGAERITGWHEDEVRGQHASFFFTPEDCRNGIPQEEMARALRDGQAEDRRWHLKKDGSIFFADGVMTSLYDEKGMLRGYGKVLRDVTDQKRADEELRYLASHARCILWHGTARALHTPSDAYHWEVSVIDEQAAQEFMPLDMLPEERYIAAWYRNRLPEGKVVTEKVVREALQSGLSQYGMEFGCREIGGAVRWFYEQVHVEKLDTWTWRVVGVAADITERKEVEAVLKAALQRERLITKVLQRPLTQEVPEGAFPGLEVATLYEPALDEAEVGGDFFDAVSVTTGSGEHRVALAVGDVTGKGLLAAAVAGKVKDVLRAFLREDPDPGHALTRLNDYLCDTVSGSDVSGMTFVALALAVVNPTTGEAHFATAGAEPPAILRADGNLDVVHVGGTPLGIERAEQYLAMEVPLLPGDVVLLATDGITEARAPNTGMRTRPFTSKNRGGIFLGYEGMIEITWEALRRDERLSLREAGQAILQGARAFGGGALRDDACLLLARRSG